MFRSSSWLAPILFFVAGGCTPPDLTAPQQELVARCLELAHKQETDAECEQVTNSMEKAYLEQHPDFFDRLLADRKALVEERIAEDQRLGNDLNACLDARESGSSAAAACEKFTERDIARAVQDRRLRGCADAQLDSRPEAPQRCAGLSDQEIEDEVRAERIRRGMGP